MSQLSLYLDDAKIEKLTAAAKNNGRSISKYVAQIIDEHFSMADRRNEEVWRGLRELLDTADPEACFDEPPEIPWELNRKLEDFD